MERKWRPFKPANVSETLELKRLVVAMADNAVFMVCGFDTGEPAPACAPLVVMDMDMVMLELMQLPTRRDTINADLRPENIMWDCFSIGEIGDGGIESKRIR